jgi:hypothetical protein
LPNNALYNGPLIRSGRLSLRSDSLGKSSRSDRDLRPAASGRFRSFEMPRNPPFSGADCEIKLSRTYSNESRSYPE